MIMWISLTSRWMHLLHQDQRSVTNECSCNRILYFCIHLFYQTPPQTIMCSTLRPYHWRLKSAYPVCLTQFIALPSVLFSCGYHTQHLSCHIRLRFVQPCLSCHIQHMTGYYSSCPSTLISSFYCSDPNTPCAEILLVPKGRPRSRCVNDSARRL